MAKVNIKTFKEALKNSGGNQARIAEKLEVSRPAINQFLKKRPKMRELLEEEAELVIDIAEDNIDIDIVVHKDVDSSKWKLLNSKRGKARGYGQKQELDINDERTRIIIEKADDDNNKVETKSEAGASPGTSTGPDTH